MKFPEGCQEIRMVEMNCTRGWNSATIQKRIDAGLLGVTYDREGIARYYETAEEASKWPRDPALEASGYYERVAASVAERDRLLEGGIDWNNVWAWVKVFLFLLTLPFMVIGLKDSVHSWLGTGRYSGKEW